MQEVFPEVLRERVFTLAHYPNCPGHHGRDKMFNSLRRDFFWPRMSVDVSRISAKCSSCASKALKNQKKVSKMTLLPSSRPLEFVAVDILGPLPKMKKGNRFLLVIGDRYSK